MKQTIEITTDSGHKLKADVPKSMISSQEMAALIIDALVDAKSDDLQKAIEVAEEEIRVRLSLGNEIKVEENFICIGLVF